MTRYLLEIYCPSCGEPLDTEAGYCSPECAAVAATPRPTRESLAEIASQLDRYDVMARRVCLFITEEEAAMQARAGKRENIAKRRFKGDSLEDAVRKHASMVGDGRSFETESGRRMQESDNKSRREIATAKTELARVMEAIHQLRVNHQTEAFDYDNYLSQGLPLPESRQAIYCNGRDTVETR